MRPRSSFPASTCWRVLRFLLHKQHNSSTRGCKPRLGTCTFWLARSQSLQHSHGLQARQLFSLGEFEGTARNTFKPNWPKPSAFSCAAFPGHPNWPNPAEGFCLYHWLSQSAACPGQILGDKHSRRQQLACLLAFQFVKDDLINHGKSCVWAIQPWGFQPYREIREGKVEAWESCRWEALLDCCE